MILLFNIQFNISMSLQPRKTRLCSNMLKYQSCPRRRCFFAHGIEDFTPTLCAFGYKCKFRHTTCDYIHPNENVSELFYRLTHPNTIKPVKEQPVRRPPPPIKVKVEISIDGWYNDDEVREIRHQQVPESWDD